MHFRQAATRWRQDGRAPALAHEGPILTARLVTSQGKYGGKRTRTCPTRKVQVPTIDGRVPIRDTA